MTITAFSPHYYQTITMLSPSFNIKFYQIMTQAIFLFFKELNQFTIITLNHPSHTYASINSDSGMPALLGLSTMWRLQVSSTYYQGGAKTEI